MNENSKGQKDIPVWMQELWGWADEFHISQKSLPRNKSELIKIKKLDLSGCELREVPECLFNLVQLTELDLGVNVLTSLPDAIVRLAQLEFIVLAWNRLETLPESFGK